MKRQASLIILLLTVLALAANLNSWVLGPAWAVKWDETYFPNLPVVTQDGETKHFYEDLIKDKIVVINFVYASCEDVCPLLTARMAKVQKKLGDRVGRDIFMYSITLDPEHDTPEVLKEHAEAFQAGPGWYFLTGQPGDLSRIRHKLGERTRKLEEHRHDVVLGNGRTHDWMRSSVFLDTEKLVMEIFDMDPGWREAKRHIPLRSYLNVGRVQIGGQTGQALFLKACASCHTIGQGDFVGPDLSGVLTRRDRNWLTEFLLAPDAMRAKKDPIAMELSAKFPGVSMPNLSLSDIDIKDLFAYLEKHDTPPHPAVADPTPHHSPHEPHHHDGDHTH